MKRKLLIIYFFIILNAFLSTSCGEKNMKFDMDMSELDSESLVFYTFSIILNNSINGNDYTSFNSYNGHLINTYSNKTFKKYVKEVL